MSHDLWTRLAIGVLVVGAPAVFLWFLGDAWRLLRDAGKRHPRDEPGEGTGAEEEGTPPRSPPS